jgi:hypothetical protein
MARPCNWPQHTALANRGQRIKPSIIHAEQEAGSTALLPHLPQIETISVRDPKNWDTVINAMVDVVHSAARGWHIGIGTPTRSRARPARLGLRPQAGRKIRCEAHRRKLVITPCSSPSRPRTAEDRRGRHRSNTAAPGSVAAPIARAIMDSYLLSGADRRRDFIQPG